MLVATDEVKNSVEAMDRSIAGAKSEIDDLLTADPESPLISDLEEAIAKTEELRARTLLETAFGEVEVVADSAADADRRATAEATELERRNHVRDGVPLAHSTLFAQADEP